MLPGLAQQERLRIQPRFRPFLQLREHTNFGVVEHAIQPPQHSKRQNHFAVFRLLVVTPQQIGDRPNKRRKVWIAHEVFRLKPFRDTDKDFAKTTPYENNVEISNGMADFR